jgi:cytochrome c-type biogenesis protein
LAAGAALGGLVVLGLVGWVAWNQGALVGLRWVEFDSPVTLAAFGFVAGIGAFFAPCAFALFPGYISYYLTSVGPGRESAGRSLALGLTCAAGSALFFALAGLTITVVGGAISPYLIATKPVIALAVALLGVVLLADVRLPAVDLPLGRIRPNLPAGAGLFLYGFGYALASTGCTLPIYVSIIVLPLTSGFSGAALLTFVSFASAMAVMMLLLIAGGLGAWQPWNGGRLAFPFAAATPQPAPRFNLMSASGSVIRLDDYVGKQEVVLIFYMGAG